MPKKLNVLVYDRTNNRSLISYAYIYILFINNIEAKRKRECSATRDTNAIRGVVVEWDVVNTDVDFLIATYFDDTDQRLLATA